MLERIAGREAWFQNREMVEALGIRIDALEDRPVDALTRFERAVSMAESADVYNAAWLTAICAESLIRVDRARVKVTVLRYFEKLKGLGYPEMTRRYEALIDL